MDAGRKTLVTAAIGFEVKSIFQSDATDSRTSTSESR